MRYLRVGGQGRERAAVMAPDGRVLGLPVELGDFDADFWSSDRPARVRELLASGSLEEVDSSARIGAPIAKPEKIVCIGLNYRDHAEETKSPIPSEPIIFMKAPNCMVGPRDVILIPRGSVKTDWEVELGVVIGQRARYLESPEAARGVIAGYVVSHDVSEREFQIERGGQWDKGKCAETFNPLGPWLVTADEVTDPQNLRLTLSVNGVVHQDGTTADMIFPVDYLVWYLSQFMVLEPGDLVNTGTPAGVSLGHDDVPYLKAGDVVELTIEGLGSQRSELSQA
ncbi:MAG TPA: fumarylacetoacetate hydrolase family protein [Acidimicrobiales bacterium]|nr:fumarylacetoacetate hydrolase family protein [Acidimicrobiales bacterium]